MKKASLFATLIGMALVGNAAFAQCPKGQSNCLDPSNYPQTITISASKSEDVVVGSDANVKTTQPVIPGAFSHQPHTTVKERDVHETRYLVVGVIDGIQYTLQSAPGAFLGTYKARITNHQYIDILIVEPSGRSYNVGTKILGVEKVQPVQTGDAVHVGSSSPTPSATEATRFVRDYCKNAKTVEELNACRGL